ncbi:MAG: ABC transporter ATP-binding protein [Candidatus Omnitrophica bacterium]|nr:ABC transporter ATP-binding protein [Candidatus Omnitrophota bacterium]
MANIIGNFFSNKIQTIISFFRILKLRFFYFSIQGVGSFFVAFFDGLSLGLLVPLIKGVIDKDFSFLDKYKAFKIISNNFPGFFNDRPVASTFFGLVLLIFLASVLKNIINYSMRLYIAHRQGVLSRNLLRDIFARYLDFGKLYFDRTSQGDINQIGTIVRNSILVLDDLSDIFVSAFTLLIYFFLMFRISTPVTLIFLLIVPIVFYSFKILISKIRKTAHQYTEEYFAMARDLFNIFSGITIVKAYNQELLSKKKFAAINESLRKLKFSLEKKKRLIQPSQEIISLFILVIVISFVAFIFVKDQSGDPSKYFIFLLIAHRCSPFFSRINQQRANIAQREADIKRVLSIFEDKQKFIIKDGSKNFKGFKEKIIFKNLNFSYNDEIPILKNVSFSINKGEIVAIVGPTGAGKTTIISLLTRFYDFADKSIFIDGVDIREYNCRSLREHIALVTQDSILFNDTIRANIAYGANKKFSDEEIYLVAEKAKLTEFINKLPQGLETVVGDRGVKLSGGERQRVSIARALCREADIVILDEATSSLDSQTEKAIQQAIEETLKNKTSIVIAHRLSTIKKANKVIVVVDGCVAEKGTFSELLDKHGVFYQLWEAQKFF